jgi:hypothetical protein
MAKRIFTYSIGIGADGPAVVQDLPVSFYDFSQAQK